MPSAFRRLNFFKGLFTSAKDWRDEQSYHIDKQRAHNRQLHLPGVISGLDVKAASNGTAVQVTAGHAIDSSGRDLHLDRDVSKEIRFDDYREPTTVHVVLQFVETAQDPRPSVLDPETKTHAFIEEGAEVSLLTEVPEDAVKLAAIRLNPKLDKHIRDASPGSAKENEIDENVRQRAGARGARTTLKDIAQVAESGTVGLAAHRDGPATEYEATVTWATELDTHSFHFASVYPVGGDGEVSWRMGCLREGGQLKYRLFIRNHGRQSINVAYCVFRLD
jgi:hypothetical protein